jgi:WD40 repeat protein
MMDPIVDLNLIDRLSAGEATEENLQKFRSALSIGDNQNILQFGKYSINIGQGQSIQIGDHIYQGLNAEMIRQIIWNTLQALRLLPTSAEQPESLPIGPIIIPKQDWGDATDATTFFGRTNELDILEQWIIHDHCRLIAIVGMAGIGKTYLSLKLRKGGIGKTDLSLKLARNIQDEFDYVIWRSLINSPDVSKILTDWIKFLSNQQETNLPDTVDAQIVLLISYLESHRCLLLLDNVESVLERGDRAGQYQEGCEGYGKLLKKIGEVSHRSCLVITSREKPKDIERLAGKKKPVRFLELGGLDYLAGKEVFEEIGDFIGSDDEWKELIDFYNGNPLALELAAHHIEEIFGGNISNFLREGKPVFDSMKELLNWHFNRLSEQEQEVMFWLAINREPVSISDLRNDIVSPVAKEQVASTIESLQRRLSIERIGNRFTLQPMLIEYMTEKFIESVCHEIEGNSIRVFNNHALLKAAAKDYIRDAQSRLIVKPVIDRLLYRLRGRNSLDGRLNEILSALKQRPLQEAGYAGGNVLNLFVYLQADLSDYDFSNLAVWQAYLVNAKLTRVNFSNSDLTKSVFSKTFGSVLAVSLSADTRFLAVANADSNVYLYDASTYEFEPIYIYQGHTNWVQGVAISSDSQVVASCGADLTIRLWDTHTGQGLRVLRGHNDWVRDVEFDPTGLTLASCSEDRTIKIWNANSGECLRTLQGHSSQVWSISFNPNRELLASASSDETIKLWSTQTGECLRTLRGHTGRVFAVSFNSTGDLLVSGGADTTVKLWDVSTGECIDTLLGHTNWIRSVVCSSASPIVASACEDLTIRLWNIFTGQCLHTLEGHISQIWGVSISARGDIVASGSEDQTVRIWDVDSGRRVKTLRGYTNAMRAIAFTPQGDQLVSGSDDTIVRLWDVSTGQCLRTFQGHTSRVRAIALDARGLMLASGGEDLTIKLWDISTGQCLRTFQGHTSRVRAVSFNLDGSILASSSDEAIIRLWDSRTGQCLHILREHTDRVLSVVFSPNGQTFASGSDDQTIKLWDSQTGQCLQTLEGHTSRVLSVAFNPNEQTLVSGSEDLTVRLWSLTTGQCLQIFQGHTDRIWSVSFSPDGQTIASSGQDQIVKLWNISNGQLLRDLQGHQDWVQSVTFSSNGEILASSSQDETIRLWSATTGDCVRILRVESPYQGMNIARALGLTDAEKTTLRTLGAAESIDT